MNYRKHAVEAAERESRTIGRTRWLLERLSSLSFGLLAVAATAAGIAVTGATAVTSGCSLPLRTATIAAADSTSTAADQGSTGDSEARLGSIGGLEPEVGLASDRAAVEAERRREELRKDIPEDVRQENDELGKILALMQPLAPGGELVAPSRVRERFERLMRQTRERFDRSNRTARSDFQSSLKSRREKLMAGLTKERTELSSNRKLSVAERRVKADDINRRREEHFARERDTVRDFEANMSDRRREFDDSVRERRSRFDQLFREYRQSYEDQKKAERVQKEALQRKLKSVGPGGRISELPNQGSATPAAQDKVMPQQPGVPLGSSPSGP